MMILDRITDWIVTAWEFIGLLFLSGGVDTTVLDRWNAAEGGKKDGGDEPTPPPTSPGRRLQPPHFAWGR